MLEKFLFLKKCHEFPGNYLVILEHASSDALFTLTPNTNYSENLTGLGTTLSPQSRALSKVETSQVPPALVFVDSVVFVLLHNQSEA
jgi:hypothetical protein